MGWSIRIFFLSLVTVVVVVDAFTVNLNHQCTMKLVTTNRRNVILASSFFGGIFGGSSPARPIPTVPGSKGATNEVVKKVAGMKHRRLGGSDIVVSELGLGTQRWVSTDFNAPDEKTCFAFLDK